MWALNWGLKKTLPKKLRTNTDRGGGIGKARHDKKCSGEKTNAVF